MVKRLSKKRMVRRRPQDLNEWKDAEICSIHLQALNFLLTTIWQQMEELGVCLEHA